MPRFGVRVGLRRFAFGAVGNMAHYGIGYAVKALGTAGSASPGADNAQSIVDPVAFAALIGRVFGFLRNKLQQLGSAIRIVIVRHD